MALTSDAAESSVAASVLRTLAYADVFGFALEATEVQRYLVGASAPLAEVEATLEALVRAGRLRRGERHFALASGDSDPTERSRLSAPCARSWPAALRWGAAIARLPYVRMVAVTGALAADNPEGGDLDYFVVTAPGRLWTARALIIQFVVRPARLCGDIVCPNYLLAEDRLALSDRNVFAAREVAQMVPLAGLALYRRFREENRWVEQLLPNAVGAPPRAPGREPRRRGRALARATERGLAGRLGDAFERFEMNRKIRELERRHGALRPEVELGPGCCKGHYSEHGRRILAAWSERLRALGLLSPLESEAALVEEPLP